MSRGLLAALPVVHVNVLRRIEIAGVVRSPGTTGRRFSRVGRSDRSKKRCRRDSDTLVSNIAPNARGRMISVRIRIWTRATHEQRGHNRGATRRTHSGRLHMATPYQV